MALTPFAEWKPDTSQIAGNGMVEALNVIPSATGYKPFPSLTAVTSALDATCRGAISVRSSAGITYNFAGTATKLYKMDSGGLTWSDVSRASGGAYTGTVDSWWQFAAYGDYVIAINGVDAPQVFQMGTSSKFAALGGSPPVATFSCAIRDFFVLGRITTAYNRVKWSALNNVADWTISATTLSDQQDLPDGGQVMGMVGGEYGVIFQERAITRMAFEGPPTAFRFDKISNTLGCRIERSIAAFENMIFFAADNGFHMLTAGSTITPIGLEKVDRWFEANFDASKAANCSAAIDPISKLYVLSFPSRNSSDGYPDSILAYNWAINQWSHANVTNEMIFPVANVSSWTIDTLDNLSSTIDGLVYPFDSRFYAGTGRLLLAGFNNAHQQGVFDGPNLAASVETGDVQLTDGRKTLLRGLRPIVEGTDVTPSVTIKYRDRMQDALNAAPAVSANALGFCPTRVTARYHRAQVDIAAGSTWDFATGIDELKFVETSQR